MGLDGRSADLRRLAESTDQLAATFAARTDALDRLATNNTRLTQVVAQHRDELDQGRIEGVTNLRAERGPQ